ncbi:hypothetical protein [Thermacetogenium phaeum]
MVGNPSTGKTHLSIGLGVAVCRDGHRVCLLQPRLWHRSWPKPRINTNCAASSRGSTKRLF